MDDNYDTIKPRYVKILTVQCDDGSSINTSGGKAN